MKRITLLLVLAMSICSFIPCFGQENDDYCLAAVKVGGKWGFIDKTGQFVINPQFDWAWDFSEGLAAVGIGDYKGGSWGFIDKSGEYAIYPQFNWAFIFHEGLAAVGIGDINEGRYGYIDRSGKYIINPQFGDAMSFSNGLARVRICLSLKKVDSQRRDNNAQTLDRKTGQVLRRGNTASL